MSTKKIADLEALLIKARVRFALYKSMASAETEKAEAERDFLREAIEEVQANHATPHRQRTGCRPTVAICSEALSRLEQQETDE